MLALWITGWKKVLPNVFTLLPSLSVSYLGDDNEYTLWRDKYADKLADSVIFIITVCRFKSLNTFKGAKVNTITLSHCSAKYIMNLYEKYWNSIVYTSVTGLSTLHFMILMRKLFQGVTGALLKHKLLHVTQCESFMIYQMQILETVLCESWMDCVYGEWTDRVWWRLNGLEIVGLVEGELSRTSGG